MQFIAALQRDSREERKNWKRGQKSRGGTATPFKEGKKGATKEGREECSARADQKKRKKYGEQIGSQEKMKARRGVKGRGSINDQKEEKNSKEAEGKGGSLEEPGIGH